MNQPLHLDDTHYIASGAERHVYAHPTEPDKLLKVMRPPEDMRKRWNLRDISTRLMPATRLRLIRKEYDEYIRVQLTHDDPTINLPISRLYGLAQTNRGLACVVERVSGADGGVGQTFRQMLKNGAVSDADLALFNDTIRRLYMCGVRAGDMTARNFVFGHRSSGPRECVLVDGFGDTHAIPIRSWGAWLNKKGLDDSCKRLALRTGLRWDPKERMFHRTDATPNP